MVLAPVCWFFPCWMDVHWFPLAVAVVVPAALLFIIVNLFSTVVNQFPLSLAAIGPAAVLSIVIVDCCSQSPF